MPKNERPGNKNAFILFAVDLLILAAFSAVGGIIIPALAGPKLPPRATVFIVIGCFIAGLAACLAVNRLLLRGKGTTDDTDKNG